MVAPTHSPLRAKIRHISDNMLYSAGTGLRMGLVVGALVGIGAALLGGAPFMAALVTIGVWAGASALNCSLFGAAWGAIKGIFTRSDPNGAEIMKEAKECGVAITPEQAQTMAQSPQKAQANEMPKQAAPQQPIQVAPAPAQQPAQAAAPQNGGQQADATEQFQKMAEMLSQARQTTDERQTQNGQPAEQIPMEMPAEPSHQDRIPTRRGSDMARA